MITIKKTKLATHSIFLIFMTSFFTFLINEYNLIVESKQFMVKKISEVRDSLYEEAYQFAQALEHHEKTQTQQTIEHSPKDGSITYIDKQVHLPKIEDTNIVSKINLLGILELELSETTSWITIIKMIITVLLTFIGYRAINLVFKRLELKYANG